MTNKTIATTPNPHEIHVTRGFDARLDVVRRAYLEPELTKRWLGGQRAIVTDIECDLRVGGSYKQAFRTHDGHEFFFTGVYSEVSRERIVHTELFNGQEPGSLVTLQFAEDGNRTLVTIIMRYDSQEIRDMVLSTGMADGIGESYDELEKLLHAL